MTRRPLLTGGGSTPDGGDGGVPVDPTLTQLRAVTSPFRINQNTRPDANTPAGGTTVEGPTVTLLEDVADLRLLFHGASQGFVSEPSTIKVAIRYDGGAWTPVLQDGGDAIEVTKDLASTTDVCLALGAAGKTLQYRVYFADGQTVNIGMSGPEQAGGDYRLATALTPTEEFGGVGPFPLAFIGNTRAPVKTVGLYGDSIAAQGQWFHQACVANGLTGINYGRNVQRFDGRWLEDAVDSLTHMLVQFGVNDLNGGFAMPALWDRAVDCYAYIDTLRPGLPIWQTTPTPIVGTTNECATLAGQTLDSVTHPRRQEWTAFLRDGAPCHPTTKAALAVGATGTVIRAGQTGHPLKGIVDIAAAVEHGGTSSPSGKWRVDQGAWGGDGVHPTTAGEIDGMAPPVSAWMATLT